MSKKRPKQCAYCGQVTTEWDMDHPVPQCLWGDFPLPPEMVTVPCCSRCNIYWSLHDGYFRTVAVIKSRQYGHPIMKELLVTKVRSHFQTDATLQREYDATLKWVPKYSKNGLYIGNERQNRINQDRLFLTVGKIVRGFFFYHKQRPLPLDYGVRVHPNEKYLNDPRCKETLADLGDRMGTLGDEDPVFCAQSLSDVTDSNLRTFHCLFYRGFGFLAQTERSAQAIAQDLSHPLHVARHIGLRTRRKLRLKKMV